MEKKDKQVIIMCISLTIGLVFGLFFDEILEIIGII